MKILYCYRYGILGGVCTQLINRLRALGASGQIETHLVFNRDYGIARTLDGYPHLHFEPEGAKVRELAVSGGFQAAIVVDTPEYLAALSDIDGVPLITEVHTTVEHGLRYLENRTWRTVGYIVPSEYSRWLLRERFGIGREEPVRVVPNSLDARLFPRVHVGRTGPRPIFAWVGKLDDHKNWRGFLELARCLTETDTDAEYWLIGGETALPERQAELIDECQRLDLHSRCRWFPRIEYGAMHRALAAVRESGGTMVVTSINESFGMSVLEALMCGCPVLASCVGALPEIMPDRPYLRFYEPGHTAEAAKLATTLLAPAEAARIRAKLDRDRAELVSKYSCETVATRYLEAVRQLLDGAMRACRRRELSTLRRVSARPEPPAPNVPPQALPAKPETRTSGDGRGELPPALKKAVGRIRTRMPDGKWQSPDAVEFLDSFAEMLGQRSYQLARRMCQHPRDRRFLLTLPYDLARIVFRRGR